MAASVQIPPQPSEAPNVHLKGAGRIKPRTLKGDIQKLRDKTSSVKSKWGNSRKAAEAKTAETRKEAETILAPVKAKASEEKKLAGEVMKPVFAAVGAMRGSLNPANGKTRPYVTSFTISSVLSWVVSPQILTAAYERLRFHTSNTDWGILHGPGRWFRDTVGTAYESGNLSNLIWAAALGMMPMIILGVRNMSAGHIAQGTYQGKFGMWGLKWLTRSAYLVPVVYLVGISYPETVTAVFGSPWTLEWWQIWVMALFCSSYYCTMWVFDRVEKGLGLGYFHVLLMTPLASVVTGVLLYAPGAAW